MKVRVFSFLAVVAVLMATSSLKAQNYGCTYTFAPEYDPAATVNDGTCSYDVQELLDDGYCIQELMEEGLPGYVFYEKVLATGPSVEDPNTMASMVIANISEVDNKVLLVYDNGRTDYPSEFSFPWGCYDTTVGASNTAIFTGEANTQTIVTNGCHLNDNQQSAAEYCYNFTAFGFDNWVLPTREDVRQAFQNLNYSNKFTSTSSSYHVWSSSEMGGSNSDRYAYLISPNGSSLGSEQSTSNSRKNYERAVLPMRYMNIGDLCSGNSSEECEAWGATGSGDVACDYPLFSCDSVTSSVWSNLPTDVYPKVTTEGEFGLAIQSDILLNLNAELNYDGNTYSVQSYAVASVGGLPQGLSAGTLQDVAFSDGSSSNTQCLELVGVPAEVGVFELAVTLDVGVDLFGTTVTIPGVVVTHTLNILENTNGIPGCTYDFAENYSPIATIDDGSCVLASIYTCPNDLDGNGIVGVGDILELLGSFDVTCE